MYLGYGVQLKHLKQRPGGEADGGERIAFGSLGLMEEEKTVCGAGEVD